MHKHVDKSLRQTKYWKQSILSQHSKSQSNIYLHVWKFNRRQKVHSEYKVIKAGQLEKAKQTGTFPVGISAVSQPLLLLTLDESSIQKANQYDLHPSWWCCHSGRPTFSIDGHHFQWQQCLFLDVKPGCGDRKGEGAVKKMNYMWLLTWNQKYPCIPRHKQHFMRLFLEHYNN